jgi:RHS repeat-associated protein
LKSSLAYPNGLTASWAYDANGQLLQVKNAFPTNIISQYDYVYDAAGRHINVSKSGSAFDHGDIISYGYNARSELTNAVAAIDSDYRYAYEFDDIGNRETSSERGTNSVYTANNLNQYTAVDDFTPEFDDDGNQTLIKTVTGIWQVQYNGENRPIFWVQGTNTIVMSYDRMGRRVAKNNQRFVYDGYLQIANFEHQTSNIKLQTFIWDPTETIATRPLVWNCGDSPAYYVHDGNKNVSEVVAENGALAAHYEYVPFGAVTAQCGASAAANPWRLSSEYAEDDTATVYYNYRHYEPVMGRWMSRDPIEEYGGLGLYLFAANCPLCYPDALGMGVFWEYFKDGCVIASSLVTMAGATMLGGASAWTGVGAVVGWTGLVIGADQFAKSVWRVRNRINGEDPANDTLITWSVKALGRSVTHEANPMFERYVDSVYFSVETVTECATGVAVIKATSVAVKTSARASVLASKEFPFRLSDDLVLVPVSNGAMISFRIESVTEVTIKAEGAIRHAVSSGSVYAIDLFNWYNDWTSILMRYGDYKE